MIKEKTEEIKIDSMDICVFFISTTLLSLQRTTVLVKARIQNGHFGKIAKAILPINPKLNFEFINTSFVQVLQPFLIYGKSKKSEFATAIKV